MKLSQDSNTQSKRLMLFGPETIVADVGVATVEIVGVVAEAGVVVRLKPNPLKVRDPSIRTYLLASGQGAKCTENSVEELTFVRNRLRVHGRMSTLHGLLNEILTSLAIHKNRFMTHYITTNKT